MASQVRPTPNSYYYSGQGRLGIADRDPATGVISNLIFIGNVTSLTVDIAVQKFEHKESMSGQRATDLTIIQEKNATFKFTAESLTLDLLEVGLYGKKRTVAGGTVTDEPHIYKAGGMIPLKFPNVTGSTIVVKKVTGGTTIANTEYDYDAKYGVIYPKATPTGLSDGDAITVSYTYLGTSRLDAFTTGTPPEKVLRFEGLNTVDGSGRLIQIPRAAFDPLTGLEFINEELGSGEFGGNILPDLTIVAQDDSQYFTEYRFSAA